METRINGPDETCGVITMNFDTIEILLRNTDTDRHTIDAIVNIDHDEYSATTEFNRRNSQKARGTKS